MSAYLRRTVDTFDLTKSIDVRVPRVSPTFTCIQTEQARTGYDDIFLSFVICLCFLQEVCSQIWATLYDYPSLKTCTGLLQYVRDSVRLAWALVNQVRE